MNKKFKNWWDSDLVSKESKDEMITLCKEEIEKDFSDKKPSYGCQGIRQKVAAGTKRFNKFTYEQIAIGYAKHLLKSNMKLKVLIGHDNRRFSEVGS